jgi:hypothetical protein
MNGPIAGYAKTCFGGGRKLSAIVPSVIGGSAKDGTAAFLVATEPASSAKNARNHLLQWTGSILAEVGALALALLCAPAACKKDGDWLGPTTAAGLAEAVPPVPTILPNLGAGASPMQADSAGLPFHRMACVNHGGVSLVPEVQAGFHPPRYAAFLTSPSPRFPHSSQARRPWRFGSCYILAR